MKIDLLYEFIEKQCNKYNIDASHGLKHAQNTMGWAKEIIKTMPELTRPEIKLIMYACGLHDCCDSKYCNVEIAAHEIKSFLFSIGWKKKRILALIKIITSMSYSKLKKKNNRKRKLLFPNHGKWQTCYHIVRHADLLEGYVVARCVLFDRHFWPHLSEEEHWKSVEKIFNERNFTFIKNGWITLDAVRNNIIPELEKKARRCLEERSMEWDDRKIMKI